MYRKIPSYDQNWPEKVISHWVLNETAWKLQKRAHSSKWVQEVLRYDQNRKLDQDHLAMYPHPENSGWMVNIWLQFEWIWFRWMTTPLTAGPQPVWLSCYHNNRYGNQCTHVKYFRLSGSQINPAYDAMKRHVMLFLWRRNYSMS